jgi:hypothetical protein
MGLLPQIQLFILDKVLLWKKRRVFIWAEKTTSKKI